MNKEFDIREDVTLPATPEQVWEAIATSDGLAAWFQPADIGPDSPMVVEWQPPTRLVTQILGADPETTHQYEFVIDAHGQGARLRFVYTGVERDDWDEKFTAEGWEMYLATLCEYLTHFAGRPATYVEAEAPPSSADPSAWSTLVGAVGLVEPIQPGRDVVIDVVPRIHGSVDYVSAHFIGLRSADALIRFHGRAPIGLPVAISHHQYSAAFDTADMTRAWKEWLHAIFPASRERT